MKELCLDANAVLDRLADAREISEGWGRDAALARELSVTSKRISTWRDRNTLDHDLIAFKCREWGLSMSWVYFGDGLQLVVPAPPPDDPVDTMKNLIVQLSRDVERFTREREGAAETDGAREVENS